MRVFLAVFPPPEVRRAAYAISEAMRQPGDAVSWVKPDNLHYTMRFIGEVGEDGARRIGEAARAAVAGRTRFEAVLGGPGAFPNTRRTRVIWLGMTEGAEALADLAQALEVALRERGFEKADKKFSPHLTLGRVRNPNRDWTAVLEAAPPPDPRSVRFLVDCLCVVESQLSPKGSIYTVREEALLG